MKLENEHLKTSFTVPDHPTVRQQMRYVSIAGRMRDKEYIERLWLASKELISDWQSEYMPDMNISLDEVTNPRITDVLAWVALQVKVHIESLDELPKN